MNRETCFFYFQSFIPRGRETFIFKFDAPSEGDREPFIFKSWCFEVGNFQNVTLRGREPFILKFDAPREGREPFIFKIWCSEGGNFYFQNLIPRGRNLFSSKFDTPRKSPEYRNPLFAWLEYRKRINYSSLRTRLKWMLCLLRIPRSLQIKNNLYWYLLNQFVTSSHRSVLIGKMIPLFIMGIETSIQKAIPVHLFTHIFL